ncbi:MAG: alpha/beta fold hydrolase [Alicyclobacillus mali]|uniref:alpha/beta hydrolase n=1 Tax=Alicyclobacillus mali (ex Roth et al. 2021) TaxID=1123961 RepID=UPI0023F3D900|nr:alpha/beta hydrolase [Alicyclobacillus mali (ex Roth et al. 2021)]MCL6488233.1 alpha/beta fold hydrolase [Alicyclobacillus mali (ex Roth et al. 2021)]
MSGPAIHEARTDKRPVFILIPGLGMNCSAYSDLAPFLSSHGHVVYYDFPEHGSRTQVEFKRNVDWGSLISDVISYLRNLNQPPYHVIGHGFGGTTALRLAKFIPEWIATLTILSPHASHGAKMGTEFVEIINQINTTQSLKPMWDMLAHVLVRNPTAPYLEHIKKMNASVNPHFYVKLLKLAYETSNPRDFAGVDRPTLFIQGEFDPLAVIHLSRLLVNQPKAKVWTCPNASNLVHMEQPEAVAREILKFVLGSEADRKFSDNLSTVNRYLIHNDDDVKKHIYVHCLNEFYVTVNHDTIRHGWERRHAQILMLYLALHRRASRDTLCEVIWPDEDPAKSRLRLRVSLHYLRALLGEHGDILHTTKDFVELRGHVVCDVADLLDRLKVLREMDSETRAISAKELVRQLPLRIMPSMYHPFAIRIQQMLEFEIEHLID